MDRSPAQTALLPASRALDPDRSVPAVLEGAYASVVSRFVAWCEEEHLDFSRVSPGLAGRLKVKAGVWRASGEDRPEEYPNDQSTH